MPARVLLFSTIILLPGAVMPAAGASPEALPDVVVYGATSAGIVAAIQARTMGRSVVVLEPGRHLGGLTAGGLGATDIGNKAAIGGLSREFYRRVGRHSRDPAAWSRERPDDYHSRRKTPGEAEMWTFEPRVAEQVYRDWLAATATPGYRPSVSGCARPMCPRTGPSGAGPRPTTNGRLNCCCETSRRVTGGFPGIPS